MHVFFFEEWFFFCHVNRLYKYLYKKTENDTKKKEKKNPKNTPKTLSNMKMVS